MSTTYHDDEKTTTNDKRSKRALPPTPTAFVVAEIDRVEARMVAACREFGAALARLERGAR